MTDSRLDLDDAVVSRTGDLWLFRGRTAADHAIRVTNAPVNHVGMAVVLDDMPPLMWHAELGKGLPCVWSRPPPRRTAHDLRAAVEQWTGRYGQRAWLRRTNEVTPAMEDELLKTIALDGMPFPATAALVGRWARGRVRRPAAPSRRTAPRWSPARTPRWGCSTTAGHELLRPGHVLVERPAPRGGARLGEEIRVGV